jgi:hypothetical protein
VLTFVQGFVKLGPIKKSVSLARRKGKVKEEYTMQGIYQKLEMLTLRQNKLIGDTATLKAGVAADTAATKAHEKAIAALRSSIEEAVTSTEALASQTDRWQKEVDNRFDGVSADLQAIRVRDEQIVRRQAGQADALSRAVNTQS